MLDLIGFDVMLVLIPLVAFIMGYYCTGVFQTNKIHSEDDNMHVSGGEIFTMNKQIIQNLGFFTN